MLTRRFWFLLVVFAVLALFASVSPVWGAPRQQGKNFLENHDFEEGVVGEEGDPIQVPEGWDIWYLDAPDDCHDNAPTFELSVNIPERNQSGKQAMQIGTRDATYTAGLFQVVEGVESGQRYRYEIWGHMLYATGKTATVSDGPDPRMRIGIDPTGGTNPFADTVLWSEVNWELDKYYQFRVIATAESSTVTVFTYSTQPECLASNFTFWDYGVLTPTDEPELFAEGPGEWDPVFRDIPSDATVKTSTTEFEVGASVGASASDEGGDKAGDEAGDEAAAPGSGTGSLCLLMFMDDNADGSREVNEAKLAGGVFTLASGSQVVGTYTTDGVKEPYCFSNLPPGSYMLTWQAQGYEATSTQGWAVTLEEGETLSREFGAAVSGGAGQGAKGGSAAGRLLRALAIAGGVIIFLLALGGVGYVVLSRRGKGGDEPPPPPPSPFDDTLAYHE